MLVLFFQSQFQCFSQFLSRFLQPPLLTMKYNVGAILRTFFKEFPPWSFILCYDVIFRSVPSFDAFTIFLLQDKFKQDQRMQNGVKLTFRYILHPDLKCITGYQSFIETFLLEPKPKTVGVSAGFLVGKGEVLINSEERRLIWDNTRTVLLQLYQTLERRTLQEKP